MRPTRDFLLALALTLAAAPLAAADAAELALTRVMLSSGGVGYFEYEASVDGNSSLSLDVPLDQVDDILKSLVVYDKTGRAGEITLPGREALAQSFTDLPFDASALASTTALLNALQGSQIRVGGDKPVAGQLVHAEDAAEQIANGASVTRTRVTVMTDGGLRQVTLKDLDAVEFVDPALQAKIKSALTRVATHRAQGRRELTIAARGDGKRTVRIGYVVAMPLWKASYRLVVPADPSANAARLQGWAVLENFSGRNWSEIELTLLSGNPVTFRQALYESYYVARPVVPVESGSRVLPPPDSGAFAQTEAQRAEAPAPASAPKAKAMGRAMATLAAPPAAPAPPPPPAFEPAQVDQASAAEGATQIAFTLPYKVSVATGQSLVVPLIDRELPAHRVDLYQPTTTRAHPLAAIELTNAAETSLPPGVLTLYQQGDRGAEYLGDARLAATPAGQKRLLNYAIDQKVAVNQTEAMTQSIVKATIAEGVMHLTRLRQRTTIYKIAASASPPNLLIEQPKVGALKLVKPVDAESTATAYRIPAMLDPKGNGTVTAVEEEPYEETVALTSFDDNQLSLFVAAKELDPKLRQALVDLAQRRQAIARQQAELDRLNEERGRLTEDESRLRDNYAALKDDPSMRRTTLDKLKTAGTAIDANAAAIAKATTALSTAQAGLAAYISGLRL